jgi:hypothetical protein
MGSAYIRNGVVKGRYVVLGLGDVGWLSWRGRRVCSLYGWCSFGMVYEYMIEVYSIKHSKIAV